MTINDSAAADLLQDLVAIPSPSGSEHKLAAFLVNRLPELGFSAHLDAVGNVVAEIGRGDGPTVMLLSHLDTVDRQIPVYRDDRGAIHGRGSVDAKGPLTAMICAAARRSDFTGTIRVIGAVEEEWLARGGHHVAATQPPPDQLIIGEPSGWSSVVLGYKGKIDITYRIQLPPTHSTNPTAKASELAVAFWDRLRAALGPELDHGSFHRPAATLRAIDGNPENALLDIDCRTPPGFDFPAFSAALHDAAGDGELDIVRYIPAVRADRANPVARSLSAGIRRQGGKPRPTLKTGTSDMNTVAASWPPIPMAAYGPGDSTLDHGNDEHIAITEFLAGIQVLTDALDDLSSS